MGKVILELAIPRVNYRTALSTSFLSSSCSFNDCDYIINLEKKLKFATKFASSVVVPLNKRIDDARGNEHCIL